jgi:hypothetical protein
VSRADRSGRAALAVAALCAMLALPVAAADPVREVHGASDAYAEPGIALAWGVRRGADEATTRVTLRVVADPGRYPRVAVTGRDPFTQSERSVLAPAATAALADLTMPRSHFADFPRTELRFYGTGGTAEAPRVVVYFLGLPDTTPEFATDAALARYLDERIARVRGAMEGKP